MKYLLLQLLLLTVSFAFWNGYIILWGVHKNIPDFDTRRKKWSKIWHGIGWVLRFQISVLIAYSIYFIIGFDWVLILKWELLFIGIASILYDLIINIVRYLAVKKPKIFYVDNKGVNKILMKLCGGATQYWVVRFAYIVGVIIWLIWY